MAKKLTSFLQSKTEWRLSVRAFIAAAALGFLTWAGISFWSVSVFLIVLGAIYFSESAGRKSLRISFWLTTLFGIFGAVAMSNPPAGAIFHLIFWLVILAFGWLIFTILGIVNLVFRHRFVVFNVLNTALVACFFLLIFFFKPDLSLGLLPVILWFLAIFWITGLFLKEVLVFGDPLSSGRNLKIITGVFGLLAAEIAALCLFLPLGFINSAAFFTLLYILGRDLILARLRGFLNVSLVLRELVILAVFASVVFVFVGWTLP